MNNDATSTDAGLPAALLFIDDDSNILKSLRRLFRTEDYRIFLATGGSIMKAPENVAETLSRSKTIGVRLSIDDFGTGYSSLSYFKKLSCRSSQDRQSLY